MVDKGKRSHMLFLQPPLTDHRISKHFCRYRNLGAKAFVGQCANHLEGFLWCKIDGQIDVRRQSSMPMQQGGNSTNHDIPHTRRIQDFEYGLVDGHTAILANTERNTSGSDISGDDTTD